MSDLTSEQQLEVRDRTYRDPEGKCCGNCAFSYGQQWSLETRFSRMTCDAVTISGVVHEKEVSSAGLCDLWKQGYL